MTLFLVRFNEHLSSGTLEDQEDEEEDQENKYATKRRAVVKRSSERT